MCRGHGSLFPSNYKSELKRAAHPHAHHHSHPSLVAHQLAASKEELMPGFTQEIVANHLPDGYWLEAFPFSANSSERPDLVGSGLGTADAAAPIRLYQNPRNGHFPDWKYTEIQKLDYPVSLHYADLTGNGFNDIIICDRYGPSMNELWDGTTNDGGRIQWLRNPGDRNFTGHWEANKIGNSTGMHRLKTGHFSRHDVIQVLGAPVLPNSGALLEAVPIVLFTPVYGPDHSVGPISWEEEIIYSTQFHVIHELAVIPAPASRQQFETAVIASSEGVSYLYYDTDNQWKFSVIGSGLPEAPGARFLGSGTTVVARAHGDSAAYVASCEAFHGNTVAVFVKTDPNALTGRESLKQSSLWTRFVLDWFGEVVPGEGTGTIHHVTSGDFFNTGVHSFVISCMGVPIGNPANQGVYMYTPIDLRAGRFQRTKITNESAAHVALADFNNPGTLDLASISYYVPGYHTGPDPPNIRVNFNHQLTSIALSEITVARLVNEALIRVPRPANVLFDSRPELPTIEVAGKRLVVCILPPNATETYSPLDGLKVIHGEVRMTTSTGNVLRTIAPAKHSVHTTLIESPNGTVRAGPEGAVFLLIKHLGNSLQGPFHTMDQLPVTNVFPPTVPLDVRELQLPFIRVQNLAWAESGLWDNYEFYNSTGFHVFFNDDAAEEIAHVQLWTLGIGETARFHDHSDRGFCEIHACITNGGTPATGLGGMRFFPDSYTGDIDQVKELELAYVDENSTLIELPPMTEHGPLWKVKEGTQATPLLRTDSTVNYPWHAWLASEFGKRPIPIHPALEGINQRYDVWLAFEFPAFKFQY